MTLVANATTYRNMKRGKYCKITNIRVQGSERRPFIFIFRMKIVQRDSYQACEIFIKIEECKQKVPDDYIKRFIRCVGDMNCILKKLYYINFLCVVAV